MSFLFTAKHYLAYKRVAQSAFAVHAPFAYKFYSEVVRSHEKFPKALAPLETLRHQIHRNHTAITVTDLGTGATQAKPLRKISYITRRYATSRKNAHLLHRVANFCQPRHILELGTSVGIATMYMATAQGHPTVTTIEGCPQTAAIAQQNFNQVKLCIRALIGNFDTLLPQFLAQHRPDMIFFDGNHTRQATLRYFQQCLPATHPKSVFIFADIHWSKGMHSAWREIIASPEVSLSMDLFHFGILFFDKKLAKQHFILKY
ncbi:MAG: class I SAM-dependent methyltransferase [Bacteroidota bacterium]